ncbi:PREDICTED: uncharacterized protein LOC104750177 [Camelina sativa]|uniref:Uncharacterized protein LOC104750177 n=1 Tax=Camelina sativa TaxID=90675 RepID=A0ABM0WF91_CAMSA|nr:PREDICTED: uncharacterized protein LOC104750177 [Camelina sativa]
MYLHLVKSTNPGTITEIETTIDKKGKTLFKYLFFAFGACNDGYKFMRKVIVIDGTVMKGKYKGCLVAASGQDGNMQIYPLAIGVVEVEDDAGWVWFFKNLIKFVPEVYPMAHLAACAFHLFRNVKHKYNCGGLAGLVSKAGRAYTVGDFRYWWRQIEETKPECAEYLLNIGLPHWTLSHFTGNCYNLISSNISESLNAAMHKGVEYPIVSMVEFIRAMLMRWFWCRRTFTGKTRSKCTPEIEELLIDHLKESLNYAVLGATDWIYQVNDAVGCEFTVDLEKKTCTCRVFDFLKIPCCHTLAACRVRNIDPYSLISECYFVGPWREKYKGVLMPCPNERDCDIPIELTEVPVNPPRTKRGGGRPKNKRIPSQGEVDHGTTGKLARRSYDEVKMMFALLTP